MLATKEPSELDISSRVNLCQICEVGATKVCSKCKSVWYRGSACQKKDWKSHKSTCALEKTSSVRDNPDRGCEVCGQPAPKACSGCRKAKYCGSDCQMAAWKSGHKNVCTKVQNALPEEMYPWSEEANTSDADMMLKAMDRSFLNKITELSGMPPKREKRPDPLNLSVSVIPEDVGNDPDASVPCILEPIAKRIFLGTPGFPKPLQHQPIRHRIAPSEGKGLGAFATVDMDAGECVISERPLVLATTDEQGSYVDASTYKIRDKTEKLFEEAVSKLTPKRRASFMKLCGVERENPRHPLFDIYQNTSISIVYPRAPRGGFYAGVCEDIARLNHSCSPNTHYTFNTQTFSFQLWTGRPIRAGEELTISYCNNEENTFKRKFALSRYDFSCECPACVGDVVEKDKIRQKALIRPKGLLSYEEWVANPDAPDDLILKPLLERIRYHEMAGMEVTMTYGLSLMEVFECHMALGHLKEAQEYRKRFLKQCPGWLDEGKVPGQIPRGSDWIFLRDHPDLESYGLWRAREKKRKLLAGRKS